MKKGMTNRWQKRRTPEQIRQGIIDGLLLLLLDSIADRSEREIRETAEEISTWVGSAKILPRFKETLKTWLASHEEKGGS